MEVAIQLQEALESVAGFVVPADFGRFRQHIDPAWIEEALDATGTASVRRRRLPAEQAIWLVIGMALLRQESIERVVMMLGLALPAARGDTAAKSGIAQARKRLGEEPLAYLFTTTADRWGTQSADRHRWRGLSLHGLDGTTLKVPDSPENWAAFGGQCGSGTRNGSAYPMVRLVAVMALRSHLLSAVYFSDYPLQVNAKGPLSLGNGAALSKAYQEVFTPKVLAAVRDAEPAAVFCRDGQAMLGDGVIWAVASGGSAKAVVVNP